MVWAGDCWGPARSVMLSLGMVASRACCVLVFPASSHKADWVLRMLGLLLNKYSPACHVMLPPGNGLARLCVPRGALAGFVCGVSWCQHRFLRTEADTCVDGVVVVT
jgi:hypothetical protein